MFNSTSKVLEDSARGGFYLTLGNILSGIVSALSLIIIARILGSEQYGLYTISTVVPSLLLIFVDPGLGQGIMKFSASLRIKGEGERLGELLLHALSFKIVLGFIASAVCFAFSDQFATHIVNRPDIGGLIRIASTLIILQTIFTTLNSIFIGVDRTEYNAVTTVAQAIAKAIIVPVLLVLGFSVAGALIGYVSSVFLASLVGGFLLIFKIYRPLNRSNSDPGRFSDNVKMLISYGFPLYIAVLIGGFAIEYRNILLSVFTSNYEIGNFQAAMNFNTIVNSISIPMATMLLPAFSKIEERKESVKEFFKISVKYTSIAVLPIAVLLMVYAKDIVQIIYGEGYELAPHLLSLYIIIYFLVGLGFNTLGSFFNGLGETKTNLKITLMSSITLIVLAPLLTYSFKIDGMVMGLILSSLVGTVYGLHVARRSFGIQVDPKMVIRVYLASVAPVLPILAMNEILFFSSILKVIVGATTYLIIYLLLIPLAKAITPAELKEIRGVLEKVKPLKYLSQPILCFEEKIMLKIS